MPINAAWHRAHRMPRNPSLDERVAWHLEHARTCGCRPLGAAMRAEMLRRGLTIPTPAASPAAKPKSAANATKRKKPAR